MKTLKGTLVLGLLVTCGVGCDEEQPPYDGSPTLVLMPDTQCYTLFAPEVMEAQTRFIEEQLTSRNIVHMAHSATSPTATRRKSGSARTTRSPRCSGACP